MSRRAYVPEPPDRLAESSGHEAREIYRICAACEQGDHGNCNMAHWCECTDDRDGNPDAVPDYAYGDPGEEE